MKEQAEDELFQILLSSMQDDQALDAEQVREYMATVIRKHFNHLLSNPRRLRILAWEAAEGWRTFATLHSADAQSCFRDKFVVIRRFLQKAREQGIIRPEIDAELLIAQVLSLCTFHLLSLPR